MDLLNQSIGNRKGDHAQSTQKSAEQVVAEVFESLVVCLGLRDIRPNLELLKAATRHISSSLGAADLSKLAEAAAYSAAAYAA